MWLAAAVVLLVAQSASSTPEAGTSASRYLDAVRRYEPGQETRAVAALHALGLRDADDVFAALDTALCRSQGARSCQPHHLIAAGPEARAAITAAWRRLYPRALALHVDALASSDPLDGVEALRFHRGVAVRLVARIDQIGREQRALLPTFAGLAAHGRHLVLWALQYLRDVDGLAAVVERYAADGISDVDLVLARGALAELLALPDAAAQAARTADLSDAFARDNLVASEERRRVEAAARVYDSLLAAHPDILEAHLRLARLLLRAGRVDAAGMHLDRVTQLRPDPRQAYLAALFLADVFERQGRVADAVTAYGVAHTNWPGAQAPGLGLARLRALAGAFDEARAALSPLHAERPDGAPVRSDPWLGYIGGQSWRLAEGLKGLQRQFEPR